MSIGKRDGTAAYNKILADWYFSNHKDRIYAPPVYKYTIVGDRVEECKQIIVHTFTLGDVEDPDLYAAHPLWEWQESEQGKWVIANCVEPPVWHRVADPLTYGYKYAITARLAGPALTAWLLKYNK